MLQRCTDLWGQAEIREADPEIEVARNAVYRPYANGRAWGVFDDDGQPFAAALDLREGVHLPPDQNLAVPPAMTEVGEWAPDGAYIYGGRINPHYGHFLINTLPRFWAMIRMRSPSTRILCHGSGTPEGWFGIPFIASAFALLGLSPSDFACFDRPMRVRNVVVPRIGLEEQLAGYRAYSRMCRAMGDRVRAVAPIVPDDRPIYYSKARLTSAVGVVTNEAEIEAVMRRAGVEIVYPETLSLHEQIRLMSARRNIFGTAGSFLHTSVFCHKRRITCLNVTEQINSNYTIIDALAENTAGYHYPPALQVLDQQETFLTARYLPDAATVASALLAAA